MTLFNNSKPKAPATWYYLPEWDQTGYRATAIAYMQRLGIGFVAASNGFDYSLQELLDQRC